MHRCWTEIDLSALERNVKRIRAALPSHIRYLAVVKANAYGHGLAQVARRLLSSGADGFAVANLGEAAALREMGATGWPILVLSAVLPGEDDRLAALEVTPVVSSAGEVERFAAAARRAGRILPVHLKVDTGMGRLGVWHTQAGALIDQLLACPELRLEGIFTHFSHADGDAAYTAHQRHLFLQVLAQLPPGVGPLLVHADNSAGLETFARGGPFNAVRVGLLQFGILPYAGSLLASVHVDPVLAFHTRVGLVKEVPAGTAISYGRTRLVERPTRLAILTAGYGDGVPIAASNRGYVLLAGQRCPILGRVTMDQTIVDATDLPSAPQPGDLATLIGTHGDGVTIRVEEFCTWGQTIPWDAFCSITQRVARVYRTDSAL